MAALPSDPDIETSDQTTQAPKEEEDPRIAALQQKITALEAQISETKTKQAEVEAGLKNPSPQSTVSSHIKLLHTYNEIRDVGQGLMGMIADKRGVTVREVYEEMGVGEGD